MKSISLFLLIPLFSISTFAKRLPNQAGPATGVNSVSPSEQAKNPKDHPTTAATTAPESNSTANEPADRSPMFPADALRGDLVFQLSTNLIEVPAGKLLTAVDLMRQNKSLFANVLFANFDIEKTNPDSVEWGEMRAIGAGMFFKGNFLSHGAYGSLNLAHFRQMTTADGINTNFGVAAVLGYQFRVKAHGLIKIQGLGASGNAGLSGLYILFGGMF